MGFKNLQPVFSILLFCTGIPFPSTSSKAFAASDSVQTLKGRVSWGHESPRPRLYYIKLVPATRGVKVANGVGYSLESGEGMKDSAWHTSAGGGDVDGVDFTLLWPAEALSRIQNLHVIW